MHNQTERETQNCFLLLFLFLGEGGEEVLFLFLGGGGEGEA